jgi:hypothetical protein
MTTENVTINLEFVGEVSDSQRELLEKLFAGTEAQNEQCCGEPELVQGENYNDPTGWYPKQPEPETCCVEGCDEPVLEPGEFFNYALADQRTFIKALIDNAPSEQVLQYVLEADQALEDAQIHIADQAERVALQAEEDEIVAEWRIAVLQASPVTASNIADWDMMAEDTKRMWRDRFYGNMEWLENFAKGDK